MTPLWHPSPNFGPRRDGLTPQIVVIHYTAMQSTQAARDWLCNPASEVSAHYLICPAGSVVQMVEEGMRAWHAGAGRWRDFTDVNSASIGIELANTGDAPFPEPQIAALERLLQGIVTRHGIKPDNVIGHSDMAPGRKIDPGPRFDWRRLAYRGLAAWPQAGRTDGDFRAAAMAAGYTAEVDDETMLAAIRLRFRPWAEGPAAPEDIACLTGLCA
ncbi:N-acetylmuramoyl-L-alanine amidase [Poseidonocella pacifica]|uniref:N-acetylmuramoyl-L-alanine amidase n=1 Tax=Poseidonocella pacifica TaxID=871651 RepID=A0A1I0WCY3_9RHOB|nr:N-acetylmuramoyl-L-alanine amidase [Poseidonocella pacifica]SFA86108.1 N-acetylmuramoyl-L-alanine amidase [Poseidonocella pacifica]